jgi:hypothetical protein
MSSLVERGRAVRATLRAAVDKLGLQLRSLRDTVGQGKINGDHEYDMPRQNRPCGAQGARP